jgi:hypothetical protein
MKVVPLQSIRMPQNDNDENNNESNVIQVPQVKLSEVSMVCILKNKIKYFTNLVYILLQIFH